MQNKLRKVLALLSCMVMLCTVLPFGAMMPVTAATTNLITNGDFEGGNTTGWSGSLTASTSAAHSGSYGATASHTSAWGSLLKQTVNVEKYTAYKVSFWYKSNDAAGAAAAFEMQYTDASSGKSLKVALQNKGSSAITIAASTTSWTYAEAYFVTGNYTSVSFAFYRNSGSAGAAASISVDDISLEKTGEATGNDYVADPGFESASSNYTYRMPSGSFTTAEAHTGQYSIAGQSATKYNIYAEKYVYLVKGGNYVLTFYAKGTVTDQTFRLYIGTNAANATSAPSEVRGSYSTHKVSADGWTRYDVAFNTNDKQSIWLSFRSSGSSATFYFDDIILTHEGSSPIVKNGNFETGDLTNWTLPNSTDASVIHKDNDSNVYTKTGKYSLKGMATNNYDPFAKQTVTVTPNTDYAIGFRVITPNSGSQPRFYVTKDGNRNTVLNATYKFNSTYNSTNGAGSWITYSTTFNSGSNSSLIIFPAQGTTDGGDIYFDDITIIPLPADPIDPDPETPSTENLIVNGDFELDSVGSAPNSWSYYDVSYPSLVSTESVHGGSQAVKLSYRQSRHVLRQDVAVEANTTYTVSFYYRYLTTTDTRVYRAGVYTTGSNGNATTSDGVLIDSTATEVDTVLTNTGWTKLSYTFNSGSNTSVRFAISGISSSAKITSADGYCVVDDIVMVEGTSTPDVPTDEPDPEPTYGDLINGDFEGEGGWTVSGGAIETIDGDKALKGTTTSRYTTIAEQIIAVEANTDYILSLNTKYVGTHSSAKARVHVYKGASGTNEALDSSNTYYWDINANTWAGKTLKFNAGTETVVRILIQQHCAPDTNEGTVVNGNIYYDDFVLVKASDYVEPEPEEFVGIHQKDKTSGTDIRFMTYNVLADDDATTGMHFGKPMANRGKNVSAMINYYNPDVIAFQEFTTNWYTAIRTNCPQYVFVNADLDGVTDSMCSALAYNPSVVRVVTSGVYKMANTYWSHQRMRYLNWAVFEVIATGERFIASSTHPDAGDLVTPSGDAKDVTGDSVIDPDGYWRPSQIREVVAQLDNLYETYKAPIIAGGDYNCDINGTYYHDTESYQIMIDAGYTDTTDGKAKDHIFYNSMATYLYSIEVKDPSVVGMTNASDHNAFFADIQFLDEFATPIKNAKDYIKTQGRNTLKDGALWLDFSASGIEFSANCEGKVALNLNVKSIKNTDATYGGIYFTVIVDGVKVDRAQCRITSTGNVELVLAENLPAGNHTFEVYRQTEHRGAEVGISSIVMEGTFNEKPADSNLYIEFIGDSISTGYGALGDVSNDTHNDNANSPLFQDATIAYPYLTAKALGADFSDVAYSGIGAKYGWQDPNMQNFYPYQRWQYDRTTLYDFNARQPDVVVIALGTNDISQGPSGDTAARKAGYQEMLDLVRSKNPDAKIVWIVGMMDDTDNTMIANLIEENGGAAEDLYCCELTTNRVGAGWHPSEAGQQVFANELVAFLNSTVLALKDEVMDGQAGLANLYSGGNHGKSSRMEMTESTLGLAFLFRLNAQGVAPKPGTHYDTDLSNATVDVFGNGTNYKLVSMGALVTNNPHVGMENMTMSDVNAGNCINIEAQYLFSTPTDDYAEFAVRVTNIPSALDSVILYARAYYVFEYDDGRLITVYDDVFSANYKHQYEDNDGVLDW